MTSQISFRLISATATPAAARLPATAMVMNGSELRWNVTGPYQTDAARAPATAGSLDRSTPLSMRFKLTRET